MKKVLFLFFFIGISLLAAAQPKEDVVQLGDLNKDGIKDKVVVSFPRDPEKITVRDDGYEYDFNRPVLSIYFGDADGKFKLWKTYKELLPYQQDEFLFIESLNVSISPKGTLTISYETFASAGSYGVPSFTYVYRFQNNDFYLIGKDEKEFSRSSGNSITVSTNYLTCKKQTVTDNMFDESAKPKEKWERIPKQPLERLGDVEL